jgi:rSAM/selenodomain-associated transferase 2
MTPKISVIVPVYKEERNINSLVLHVLKTAAGSDVQIIISDGSPDISTLKAVWEEFPGRVKLHSAKKGRGSQMNAAAARADGDILLFLHADTRLPENAFDEIAEALRDPATRAGAFRIKFDSKNLFLKFVAFTATLRSRLTGIPFGDQAMFIRKKYFDSIGGFKDIPLMEDTELMKRIKENGGGVKILSSSVVTSARKWQKDGMLFNTLRNHLVRFLYFIGASPELLYRVYYGQ